MYILALSVLFLTKNKDVVGDVGGGRSFLFVVKLDGGERLLQLPSAEATPKQGQHFQSGLSGGDRPSGGRYFEARPCPPCLALPCRLMAAAISLLPAGGRREAGGRHRPA